MSVAMIFAVAGLVGAGTFLVTSRSLSRIVLGFAMLGHAAALSLTAIVISFGLTLFVLALARRQQVLTGDDLVEDDVEDRRIATTQEARAAAIDETRELEALHDNPEGGS